jgi:hypothetical protein
MATAVSETQINLSWNPSTDNVGVAGYDVYRSGSKLATITGTSFGDTGLTADTAYSYYVIAKDAAGNQSAQSNTASTTTKPSTTVTVGSLTGVVSNDSGPLSGATVSIVINGVTNRYSTNSAGVYLIQDIPAGTYSINYNAKRLKSQSVTVDISASTTTTQNVTLTSAGNGKGRH